MLEPAGGPAPLPPRIDVGGQAVVEGVMMRSPRSFAVVCRRANGDIVVREDAWTPIWDRLRFLRWPFLRGAIVLLESLWNGMSALMFAADQQALDLDAAQAKDAAGKPEITAGSPAQHAPDPQAEATAGSQAQHAPDPQAEATAGSQAQATSQSSGQPPGSGSVISNAQRVGLIAISLGFGLALFVGAPHLAAWGVGSLFGFGTASVRFHLVDGLFKVAILVGYMAAISLMPDIKRVFEYHGAEHKAIRTHELDLPLTIANARLQTRFHPRCGTSFLLIVLLVSIVLFALTLRGQLAERALVDHLLKILLKVPLMFPIAGLAYEAIKLSGRHYERSVLARVLAQPGLWLQHITTREPSDDQLEIALVSIRKTLWRERAVAAGHADLPKGSVEVLTSAADLTSDAALAPSVGLTPAAVLASAGEPALPGL